MQVTGGKTRQEATCLPTLGTLPTPLGCWHATCGGASQRLHVASCPWPPGCWVPCSLKPTPSPCNQPQACGVSVCVCVCVCVCLHKLNVSTPPPAFPSLSSRPSATQPASGKPGALRSWKSSAQLSTLKHTPSSSYMLMHPRGSGTHRAGGGSARSFLPLGGEVACAALLPGQAGGRAQRSLPLQGCTAPGPLVELPVPLPAKMAWQGIQIFRDIVDWPARRTPSGPASKNWRGME